jgi:site-specific DNA-methyltransferase (adenine-specific)
MKVVGNCEYAVLLYRDKLPKFNNKGKMIMNCMDWTKDTKTEKVHPTQKPVDLLERLIEIFTDEGEVVIDPVAGSGSTLIAANNKGRKAFGFEIKKNFFKDATRLIEQNSNKNADIEQFGYAKTELSKINPILF